MWMFVNLACAPTSYDFPLISLLYTPADWPDTDMCDITFTVSLQSLSLSLSLSESLSESALILPSIVPSPPITQNQEKHTPTPDWGSDKIKHTRRLIWITGAGSIRVVRDSEPDREAEMRGNTGCEGKANNIRGKENHE